MWAEAIAMALISEEEKLRRRQSNEDAIGTLAMEGLSLDAPTLALMRRFEEGEIDREELSAAVRSHVAGLHAQMSSTGLAEAIVGAA
jgi:hypothetical protein